MKKRERLTTVLLIAIFFAGLSLVLYPTVSNHWNAFHQTRAIASYTEKVASLDEKKYEMYWQAAAAFNAHIPDRPVAHIPTERELQQYSRLLDPSETGVMGYIDIPEIQVTLPIYHGTSEGVLQIAVGHLDWTSLPVGGDSTHCVLSGHRGLPSAKLFTDLDRIVVGDVFMLRVLNEVLTYQVDQILTVEPENVDALQIVEGKDYCTLVTCTPYGINTHRLLVRGHRIANTEEAVSVHITSEAIQIEPLITASIAVFPVLVLMMATALATDGKRHRRSKG